MDRYTFHRLVSTFRRVTLAGLRLRAPSHRGPSSYRKSSRVVDIGIGEDERRGGGGGDR